MDTIATVGQEARARLTDEQVQDLVVRTVADHAESLLRTAYRHSLCADDAHDAYQRSMEILLRRAHRLDPASVHKWLQVVIKHEALEVRRTRAEAVNLEDVDFDRHESLDVTSPEERAVSVDRTTRAAEALRRLKPQELKTMWLKAMGHSYAEISDLTGFSPTKVNRCLAEGRKSFLERFEGIEAGDECERWQPVLSAIVDGEATAEQMTELRPHLRNCGACRATLRGLHDAHRPLAAVLPFGLVGAGAKVSGLLERLMPGLTTGSPEAAGAAVGGAGILGAGGAKLAAVLASSAAALGGGTAVVHYAERAEPRPPAVTRPMAVTPAAKAAAVPVTPTAEPARERRSVAATTTASAVRPRRSVRVASRAKPKPTHAASTTPELKPLGQEVATPATSASTPDTAPTPAPAGGSTPAAAQPHPTPTPTSPQADSSSGEFAPQP